MRLYIINRKKAAGYLLIFAGLLVLMTNIRPIGRNVMAAFSLPIKGTVVVIDPGHGGMDPGALGAGGMIESEVNLKIAMKLRKFIEQGGGTAIMIREDDTGLYTEGGKGSRKSEDLKNRHALINSCGADILISIHMNSFPQSRYYGAQTFYMENDEKSRKLAEQIQQELIKVLDRGNTRKAKPINTVYLLKNNSMPGVLVECGFLSNPEEERLLADEKYQEKVAWSIFVGIMKYLENEKEERQQD